MDTILLVQAFGIFFIACYMIRRWIFNSNCPKCGCRDFNKLFRNEVRICCHCGAVYKRKNK